MEIDLEVIGRHAMLFDDDAQLEFVNSKQALIEWNSLFIDRFDVRNLITSPPTTFRNLPTSFYHGVLPVDDSHLFPDLDVDRFADLNHVDHNHADDSHIRHAEVVPMDNGGYNCVPFSYGNSVESTDQKDSDMSLNASSFHPSFPLPDNLLQNLPTTEKVHQIIARTAMFVGEHGGQSEIVLRVKQGDNPTFGFLMPHHHLHPYFRYLVDHPEVLKTNSESRSEEEKTDDIQASGALSLLGSVYDSGEDDEVTDEAVRVSEQTLSGGASIADNQSEQTLSTRDSPHKGEKVSVPQLSKVKTSALSTYGIKSIKPGRASSIKSDEKIKSLIGSSMEKPKASSLFPVPDAETSLVDPPCEMKRLVDRIIEVILKNGRDFEKVLIEQDKNRGKFPFLLSSNQYNPYYLRVLKKAQESRISGKTFRPSKDGSSWQELDKNDTQQMKDNDLVSDGSDDSELDLDKKEKFKMVISKPKKDSQDQQSKGSREQCGFTVDTEAAAAILQAATRGIRKPNLNVFSKSSHGTKIEDGPSCGSQRLHSSKPQSLVSNENEKSRGKTEISEIDIDAHSSESGLMRQQKLKAERLRRAKMFAAMIKSGVSPLGTETVRASSVEQSGPGNLGLVVENITEEVKGREGSLIRMEILPNLSNGENEQKLTKRRHYRSRKHDDEQGEELSDGNEEESDNDEDDTRRSRKRHKSLHSTRHHRSRSKDHRHKHRSRYSSSKSKEYRYEHKHKSSSSLEDDDDKRHREKLDDSSEEECKHSKRRSSKSKESRHWHKHKSFSSLEDDDNTRRWEESDHTSEEERKHRRRRSSKSKGSRYHHNHESSSSLDDDDDRRHKTKPGGSSEEEQRPQKRRHRNDNLSEDESKHHKRKHKRSHRKDRHRERSVKNDTSDTEEVELEEGEIRTRSSEQSLAAVDENACREASVDASKSPCQEKGLSLPPSGTTEVPDELRAKIRAMLLATM